MKRREFLLLGPAAYLAALANNSESSRLSVEGYIFQQYAERGHKRLADVLDEIFPLARRAGFKNIEINQALEIAALCKTSGCRAVVNNPDPKLNNQPKTDAELVIQVKMLDRLGRELARRGFHLWTHAHAPEMADHAREWRYNLHHTD